MQEISDRFMEPEGRCNRIAFCSFWIGMYIAVIYSRYLSGQPGLIQNSAQIKEFDVVDRLPVLAQEIELVGVVGEPHFFVLAIRLFAD
jgi:hypothetical protein